VGYARYCEGFFQGGVPNKFVKIQSEGGGVIEGCSAEFGVRRLGRGGYSTRTTTKEVCRIKTQA
jgi:hypothetical protein